MYRYLSEDQLSGFKNYKYSSVDTSPVSQLVCHPFWNAAVKVVPKWIAPNVLTFVGFMLCIVNYVILSWYDYYFYASSDITAEDSKIPNLVWLVCAILQFLSHTLDGIDGKQARRINMSGPLGELFDHGLDSWVALFVPCAFISVFGRGDYSIPAERIYFILMLTHIAFMLSHFEKYNTGVLYLPWAYDISQISITCLYVITFFGQRTWKFHVLNLNPGNIFEILVYFSLLVVTIPVTFYNIYACYKSGESKHKSAFEASRPLVSSFALFALCTLWAFTSRSNILFKDPRLFYFMIGTIHSNIMCRLIVSQMSNTRCELLNLFLLPLCAITFSLMILPSYIIAYEYVCLWIFTCFVTLAHVHYGISIVSQMCEFFNVSCFRVKNAKLDK